MLSGFQDISVFDWTNDEIGHDVDMQVRLIDATLKCIRT